MKICQVTLNNINNGAVNDLFLEALKKVLNNIADPNTSPAEMRKINIEISVKPHSDRTFAEINLRVTTKLAQPAAVSSRFFIENINGEPMAIYENLNQPYLFDIETNKVKEEKKLNQEAM